MYLNMYKNVFVLAVISLTFSVVANNRSNQMNPNNSAYYSSRGISNNHRSNQNNPNNKAYRQNYNNRSNQLNSNNKTFWSSRDSRNSFGDDKIQENRKKKIRYKEIIHANGSTKIRIPYEEEIGLAHNDFLKAINLFNSKQYKQSFALFSKKPLSNRKDIGNYLG